MSGTTGCFRPAGQTVALSVTASSHAAVDIIETMNDEVRWVAVVNPGSVAVAVKISQQGVAATLPVDGTPGDFLLPPLMQTPICLPLGNGSGQTNPKITAIGAAAGPTLIYATPVVMQS